MTVIYKGTQKLTLDIHHPSFYYRDISWVDCRHWERTAIWKCNLY